MKSFTERHFINLFRFHAIRDGGITLHLVKSKEEYGSVRDEFSEKFQRGGGFRGAYFKVCLFLIFLNTIVDKTYPEP